MNTEIIKTGEPLVANMRTKVFMGPGLRRGDSGMGN
jgi:hypothetical protein